MPPTQTDDDVTMALDEVVDGQPGSVNEGVVCQRSVSVLKLSYVVLTYISRAGGEAAPVGLPTVIDIVDARGCLAGLLGSVVLLRGMGLRVMLLSESKSGESREREECCAVHDEVDSTVQCNDCGWRFLDLF